jgi:predicted phosphodiesterase
MRDIIIGDVHGCLNELKELIKKLKLSNKDKIYFIGDLIDRGYDSAGVIKYIYELSRKYNIILILGNHDEKFLRYINKNKKKIKLEFENLINILDKKHIDFYLKSYYNYFIPQKNILLVHAGITHDIKLNFCENIIFNGEIKKTKFSILNLVRQIDDNGKMKSFDLKKGIESKVWYEDYNGEYGTIIFGHTPMMSNIPIKLKNSYCIDNGCVFGGWLSAIIINQNNNISFETVKFIE